MKNQNSFPDIPFVVFFVWHSQCWPAGVGGAGVGGPGVGGGGVGGGGVGGVGGPFFIVYEYGVVPSARMNVVVSSFLVPLCRMNPYAPSDTPSSPSYCVLTPECFMPPAPELLVGTA